MKQQDLKQNYLLQHLDILNFSNVIRVFSEFQINV